MAKLLIISDMAHYERDGQIVGHGPTAREISYLATRFEHVQHVACFHVGPAPAMMLPYSSERVHLIPMPFAGGDSLAAKVGVLRVAALYIRTILSELRALDPDNDVVHVRCAAPISLIAIMLLAFVRSPRKRWVKYAGNWQPGYFDSSGYAIQRWWLMRGFARAKVTVNGQWPNQPPFITAFVNPCLTREELDDAQNVSAAKPPLTPLRLIFVGQITEKKGVGRALEITRLLLDQGLDVTFDIIGDGPQRAGFEAQAAALGLQSHVCFHGWVARTSLAPLYAQSHIMLFPSDSSEGWPKVISEAMAYGVVPVASNVSSIPQYLQESGVGVTFNAYDLDAFAAAIIDYTRRPDQWQRESAQSIKAAERFSYDVYLANVTRLLELE
ncbi:MAG: glycosyltransferase family 4 protein [Burkholderiales bacterium]|nr:glycosyltransferase family 4 protein [Anaerolineae bacterium]